MSEKEEYPDDVWKAAEKAFKYGFGLRYEVAIEAIAHAILAYSQRDQWQDIAEAPEGRCLMWVADGGSQGKGEVTFGHVFVYPDSRSYRPDGYHGTWNVTHFMPIPASPKGRA